MSPNMFEKGMEYPKKDYVAENDMCNAYPLLPQTHTYKRKYNTRNFVRFTIYISLCFSKKRYLEFL